MIKSLFFIEKPNSQPTIRLVLRVTNYITDKRCSYMPGNDHMALAHYLIQSTDSFSLQQHKKAFLLGCIEPDCNPFTYIRGSLHCKAFCGHNAENSKEHILKCLAELQNGSLHSSFGYFKLGTLIHYIADSFTFPHTKIFTGNMLGHVDYERKLHQVFYKALIGMSAADMKSCTVTMQEFLEEEQNAYSISVRKMTTDCDYIIKVCEAVFKELLCCS